MARANWIGQCGNPACSEPIKPGDTVVRRKGVWIHTGCAPGSDDE